MEIIECLRLSIFYLKLLTNFPHTTISMYITSSDFSRIETLRRNLFVSSNPKIVFRTVSRDIRDTKAQKTSLNHCPISAKSQKSPVKLSLRRSIPVYGYRR